LAQICTAQTGELLINETFGTARANSSLAEGRTTYQLASTICPIDGEYSLADTVSGSCFNFTWHTVLADHTPNDTRGNMMVVNGAYGANAFYQQPLTTLCGGANYEISVWAINLLKPGTCTYPLSPDLTISIETADGRVIQTTPIGTIPLATTPTWARYAAVFTAPTTDEPVVVKLIDNQGDAGCGNDLAIDDIQLKQCSACTPDAIYVPDAFTPNNDGMNDALRIVTSESITFDMKIYNRWGSVIFTSNRLDQQWDGTYNGTPCAADAYTWSITYRSAKSARLGSDYVQTGRVLLIR
jgi:gliding motility-associated-like protein